MKIKNSEEKEATFLWCDDRFKLKKTKSKNKIQRERKVVLHFPVLISNGGAQDSLDEGAQDRDLVAAEEEEKEKPGLCLTVSLPPSTSARKLAATFWELHQYNLPFAKMHNGGGGGGNRRSHRYQQLQHHHHHHLRHHLLEDNPDPFPASPDLVIKNPFLLLLPLKVNLDYRDSMTLLSTLLIDTV